MSHASSLPAKFITIEGGEGVGKTTNIEFIQRWLGEQNISYVLTREPGGTPLAEDLRNLLLSKRDEVVSEDCELLLMFAARAQHIQQVIKPALDNGLWVICDRFTDATYAYQGGGRGLSEEKIAQLENLVQAELRPDLTILLDVAVEVGMSRAQKRGALDRFESEQLDFFNRVRQTYLARAEQFPAQYRVVDAGLALDQVQNQIKRILNGCLDE